MAYDGEPARAFWVTAPGHGEIRQEALRAPADGEARIRTLYSGISRGTETLVFEGRVPASEYQRMRAPFQAGEFPAPVKYGYMSVGRVEEGPASLRGLTVFCLYPHQTRYIVPVEAVHPLPATVPPERGVLAANVETAVNGLWDASPRIGDRIAVVGAGVVGCLVAWLAAGIRGCSVQLVDIDAGKRQAAEALGLELVLPANATPEADLVVHASGSPQGLATALELAAFEATILEMSWYGDRPVEVPLGQAFHSRRLRLKSSQVGAIAAAQRPRWTTRRRMALAVELLQDPRLDALITDESDFDELPRVMKQLSEPGAGTLCRRIRYA